MTPHFRHVYKYLLLEATLTAMYNVVLISYVFEEYKNVMSILNLLIHENALYKIQDSKPHNSNFFSVFFILL